MSATGRRPDRRRPAPATSGSGSADVFLGPQRHVAGVARRGGAGRRARVAVLRGQRRRQDLPVHAERDVAAGDRPSAAPRAHRRAGSRRSACRGCPACVEADRRSAPSRAAACRRAAARRLEALARRRSASRTAGWLAMRRWPRVRDAPTVAEHLTRSVGDEQQVRVELRPGSRRPRPARSAGRWCRPPPSACGASAMSRAIIVKVSARVVRSCSTSAPVATISRCSALLGLARRPQR